MSSLHQSWKDEQAAPAAHTSTPTLPDDIARCNGRIVSQPNGSGTTTVGQAECVRCLRRTAPRDIARTYSFIAPPAFVGGVCNQRKA